MLDHRGSNLVENIKNKMDMSRMLTSKIPGGSVAIAPLDFTLSMMEGMPLTEVTSKCRILFIKRSIHRKSC